MERAQKNAIGVKIELTVKENGAAADISTANVKNIILRKPDGVSVTKTAVFSANGTDGKIHYLTVSGDLDLAGNWEAQADLSVAGFTGRSSVAIFQVLENL